MEEKAKNLEEKQRINEEQVKKSHRFIIIFLASLVAVFLGALFAFFMVFSSILKHTHFAYSYNDDVFKNTDQEFGKMLNENQIFPPIVKSNPNIILKPENAAFRSESTPKEYKFIINLKSFGNNEKNVDLKTDNNRIIISAKYNDKKDKNSYSSASMYESFSLPEKVDNSKIRKLKTGDNLVIIIPKSIQQH